MIMKQSKEKFDFKAFGQAIKAARKAKGISRNQLADKLNIAPRYIASIENSGQHPSLQILYELVTLLDVSVDQFFFPEREQEKSTPPSAWYHAQRHERKGFENPVSYRKRDWGSQQRNNGGIKFPRFFIEKAVWNVAVCGVFLLSCFGKIRFSM